MGENRKSEARKDRRNLGWGARLGHREQGRRAQAAGAGRGKAGRTQREGRWAGRRVPGQYLLPLRLPPLLLPPQGLNVLQPPLLLLLLQLPLLALSTLLLWAKGR